MDPARLNIRHLRAVAAVAQTGSITSATRLVNLTQPAITQGLAKLERQIGLTLFERGASGMVPTEAGRVLAPRVREAMRLIDNPRATSAQIAAFLAVARAGGYAAAAAETGLSEASLHRAVADLSISVGQTLIERRGRGTVVTTRGAAVARGFRLGMEELRSALAELAALAGREVGRITVGAMPLSRARLLPEATARFHAAHDQIELRIVEGSRTELLGPLREGEIDLMVGALRLPAPETDVVQTALFQDRPIILGRAGHPLSGLARPPSVQTLARFPWIVPGPGTPLRTQWNGLFVSAGVAAPRVPIECGSVIMIRQMLLRSDMLTLLSPDQVAVELEAGWLTRIAEAPETVSRVIGVTTRADWRPTRLQSLFLRTLADQAQQMSNEKKSSH